MRTALRVGLLTPALALATLVAGWWAVPVLGVVWGMIAARGTRPGLTVGGAAAGGWALLLVWRGLGGPVWRVAERVGPILALPGWLFVVLALIFPAVLALVAAEVGGGIAGLARRQRESGMTSDI